MTERTYDVYWEGPWPFEECEKQIKAQHVLYQLYGVHPVYGKEVLLYVGRTKRGFQRLREHDWWVKYEADKYVVRAASVGLFQNWKVWDNNMKTRHRHGKARDALVSHIERLLIHAHQPAYNQKGKGGGGFLAGIRVLNTGKFGTLLPELSSLYYFGK